MTHDAEHQEMRENPATVMGGLIKDVRDLREKVAKMEKFLKSKGYDPSKTLQEIG